jgi:hypothetical protein
VRKLKMLKQSQMITYLFLIYSRKWNNAILEELRRDEYNIRSDYLELILQVSILQYPHQSPSTVT